MQATQGELHTLADALRRRGLRIPPEVRNVRDLLIAVQCNGPVPRGRSSRLLSTFDATEHPRGQPDNAGQFVKGGSGTSTTSTTSTTASSKPATTSVTTAAKPAATTPHSFPTGDTLATAPGKHLKGGGEVRTAEVGGTTYIVKQAPRTDRTGPIEVLTAGLAQVAGVPMPAAQMTTINGRPAVVQTFVAGTAAGRASLSARLEMYVRSMVMDYGIPEAKLTPEGVLRWIAANRAGTGRNWMVLEDGSRQDTRSAR